MIYSVMFYWRVWSGSRVSKVTIMQLSRPPAPPHPPKSMLTPRVHPRQQGCTNIVSIHTRVAPVFQH